MCRSASATTGLAVTALAAPWQVAGTGEFNADGKADILWRNPTSGANVIWLGADSTKTQAVTTVSGAGWIVPGIADFLGDGRSDILWRNTVPGYHTIWFSGSSAPGQAVTGEGGQGWQLRGVGGFHGGAIAATLLLRPTTPTTLHCAAADSDVSQP